MLPEVGEINLAFHPTIMAPWGEKALAPLDDAREGKLDPFVLVFEGSIPAEEQAAKQGGYYCSVGDRNGKLVTANEILAEDITRI